MAKKEYLNLLQFQTSHEAKFFEMIELANTLSGINLTEKKLDDRGLIKGTDLHWFQACFDYIPKVLFNKYTFRRERILSRGLELRTEHPVDTVYDNFRETYLNKKIVSNLSVRYGDFVPMQISTDDGSKFLEMFDYCETVNPGFPAGSVVILDDQGFIDGTKYHWFQVLFDHMMKIIMIDDWKWQCKLGRQTLITTQCSPIQYLFDKYTRKLNKVSYYDKTELDFVRENQEREDRRKEREKAKKLKEKYAEKS